VNAYKLGPDLGDCIAGLCVVRHLGRGHIRLFNTPGTKGFSPQSYEAIRPLIEFQDYAESVRMFDENEEMEFTHDFTGFRAQWGCAANLATKQAVHVGLKAEDISLAPWLKIGAFDKHNKIAVCRSTRNKGLLAWYRIWQTKARESIFLGCDEDYDQFNSDNCPWPETTNAWYQKPHQARIEFRKTSNLLEAARLIMGSRLFFVNQTSLLWVALGMGFSPIMIEQTTDDSYLPAQGRRYIRHVEDNPTIREFMHL
jgi:hypothetical protein